MKKTLGICLVITLFILIINLYLLNNMLDKKETKKIDNNISLMLETEFLSKEYEQSKSNKWPDSEYVFNAKLSKCENGSKLAWNEINRSIKMITDKTDKCYVYFDKSKSFTYTGAEQTFIVPEDGIYKIELWGAQGGNAVGFRQNQGGKGAYVKGNVKLNKDTNLFIYVGGKGEDAKTEGTNNDGNNRVAKGGFNGGGDTTGIGNCCGAGGGGATHIAFSSGLLKDLFDKQEDILMVASAGGGASRDFARDTFEGHGGSGGIYKGYDGNTAGNTQCLAHGATSNAGGLSCTSDKNGLFGTAYTFDLNNVLGFDGGAGGSGFYAGGTATCSGGGGGTSYISNNYEIKDLMLVDGEGYQWLNEKENLEITGMPNPLGGTENGHTGNGYARITLIS